MAHIRRAVSVEAAALTELALSSKAVWGYDDEFIAKCRDELTITPDFIALNDVYVIEIDRQIAGFYALLHKGAGTAVLDFLYVHPDFLHRGLGTALWKHASANANRTSVHHIHIDADPHAEPFYQAMGAVRIGMAASGSIPGRFIPQMAYRIGNMPS